jgi:hypothetical protein
MRPALKNSVESEPRRSVGDIGENFGDCGKEVKTGIGTLEVMTRPRPCPFGSACARLPLPCRFAGYRPRLLFSFFLQAYLGLSLLLFLLRPLALLDRPI